MNIAELVLNLGVKGSDKTAAALGSMQKGLKDTSSMALETKVALAGAVYALERLFAASGQRGTDLANFNTLTGVSVQRLQQYQYAARQVGASNEEMEGTFKGLQAQMTEQLTGGHGPAGFAHVAKVLGINITQRDVAEFAKKPEKLIQILQDYAQKEKDIGMKRKTLGTFQGVTDNIQTGLSRGVFNEGNLRKAPTYKEKEVGALNEANIAWSNLRNKIEMSIGKFNAEHGNELVSGISRITDQVLKLVEAFSKMADKLELFRWFGEMIKGWTSILGVVTEGVEHPEGLLNKTKETVQGAFISATEGPTRSKEEETLASRIRQRRKTGQPVPANYDEDGYAVAPKSPAAAAPARSPVSANTPTSPVGAPAARSPATKAKTQREGQVIPITAAVRVATPVVLPTVNNTSNTHQVNVNQTLQFNHDGKEAQKIGSDHKKAANEAYRQMPQGQVK